MRGLQKSKRVSWASEVNLCQVRLFLSEDSPSLVGSGGQDDLQAKASWPSYSSAVGGTHDDNLPPGFEGTPPASLLKNKLSQIPIIKWSVPAMFIFDPDWKIVAGEESKEVEIQNQREMRVLEAVYPRPSAIPPNPAVLPGIENSSYNDELTPLIPLTPIEDEDAIADTADDNSSDPHRIEHTPQSGVSTNNNTTISSSSSSQGMQIALEPEVLTAINSVLTSGNDQANLIDPELLVQILSNPGFMERLATTSTQQAVTNPSTSLGVTLPDPPLVHVNRNDAVATMSPPVQSGPQHVPFYPPPNRVGPSAPPPPLPPPAAPKDINYYKSLIQQHGGERNDSTTQPPFGGRHNNQVGGNPEASVSNHHQPLPPPPPLRARDSKPKINKPCIYFNSSRGCRHGANCAFQHDVSGQQRGMQDVQNTKRMKVEREITGTL